MARHPFLEKIQRAREAAEAKLPAPEHEQAKPTEQLTDDEFQKSVKAIAEALQAALQAA